MEDAQVDPINSAHLITKAESWKVEYEPKENRVCYPTIRDNHPSTDEYRYKLVPASLTVTHMRFECRLGVRLAYRSPVKIKTFIVSE